MNGAGKTTTFKMLTRDVTITQGDIFCNGVNSTKNSSQVRFPFFLLMFTFSRGRRKAGLRVLGPFALVYTFDSC